jgi:hypothetical protein
MAFASRVILDFGTDDQYFSSSAPSHFIKLWLKEFIALISIEVDNHNYVAVLPVV